MAARVLTYLSFLITWAWDTTALGFIAGFTGEEIVTQLNSFGVKEDFIRLREGLTRINVKVKASDEETEINGRGPIISDDELEALYKQLDALTEKDTLILAGSIPSSLPSDMYELIMERLQHKKYSHRRRCYKGFTYTSITI